MFEGVAFWIGALLLLAGLISSAAFFYDLCGLEFDIEKRAREERSRVARSQTCSLHLGPSCSRASGEEVQCCSFSHYGM